MGLVAKEGKKNATDGEWGLRARFAWNPKGKGFYLEETKHALHGCPLLLRLVSCHYGQEMRQKTIVFQF